MAMVEGSKARKVAVLTLFPEMFTTLTEQGVVSKAVTEKFVEFRCFNPRDFTSDRHRTVDDKPYGGGPGMVMKVEPLLAALDEAKRWIDSGSENPERSRVIYLSPQGERFSRQKAHEYAQAENLIFVCGRYEGVDQRFIDLAVDEEMSIGDFVLSGGELAAMVILDATWRRIPGVLGDVDSVVYDSFEQPNLFDHPHYTRPEKLDENMAGIEFCSRKHDLKVPEILLSGDHAKIKAWREVEAKRKTLRVRPDLFEN